MEKKNTDLLNKINEHWKKNSELENIFLSRGETKLCFIYDLIDNKIEMKSDDSNIYLEVYIFFIRMRRFIFKWTNYIEDNLTGIYVDNIKNKSKSLKKILCKKSFSDKAKYFFKKDDFFNIYNKIKKINTFKSIEEYKIYLDKIINLRNWISHIDLFFLYMYKKEQKDKKDEKNQVTNILEIKELLKYFLHEKLSIPRLEKNWDSFDDQWKKTIEKTEEISLENKEELEKIIDKILKFDFSLVNFFNKEDILD